MTGLLASHGGLHPWAIVAFVLIVEAAAVLVTVAVLVVSLIRNRKGNP